MIVFDALPTYLPPTLTVAPDSKRKPRSLRTEFKYPEHIYHDPMAWLFEDYGKEHEERIERERLQKLKEEQEQAALRDKRASYGMGAMAPAGKKTSSSAGRQ